MKQIIEKYWWVFLVRFTWIGLIISSLSSTVMILSPEYEKFLTSGLMGSVTLLLFLIWFFTSLYTFAVWDITESSIEKIKKYPAVFPEFIDDDTDTIRRKTALRLLIN